MAKRSRSVSTASQPTTGPIDLAKVRSGPVVASDRARRRVSLVAAAVQAVIFEVIAATRADSPGGKRITVAEAAGIADAIVERIGPSLASEIAKALRE